MSSTPSGSNQRSDTVMRFCCPFFRRRQGCRGNDSGFRMPEHKNARTKPPEFYTLGRHKKTGIPGYSGFQSSPRALVSSSGVLQKLHEGAVGVDHHDVVLAGERFLVRLQAPVKAVKLFITAVGIGVYLSRLTIPFTSGCLGFGKRISQSYGLLTIGIGTDTFRQLKPPGTELLGQLLTLGRHSAIHVLTDRARKLDGFDSNIKNFDTEFFYRRLVSPLSQRMHQLVTLARNHFVHGANTKFVTQAVIDPRQDKRFSTQLVATGCPVKLVDIANFPGYVGIYVQRLLLNGEVLP